MTLTQILQKIKNAFYTKKEIDSMGGGGTSLDATIKSKADVNHNHDSVYLAKNGNAETATYASILRTIKGDIGANDFGIYIYDGVYQKFVIGTDGQGSYLFRGNADSATNDDNGNNIVNTYAKNNDVVHKSGNEWIGGIKNFNNVVLGEQDGVIRVGNNGEGAHFCTLDFDGQFYNNTFNQFVPKINNEYNLGTSTNKWKTINGINPGALSLPGDYVNIDWTNWKLDGTRFNIRLQDIPTISYTYGYLSIVAICTSSSDYGWVYDEHTRIGNCTTAISDGLNMVVDLFIPITNINNSILCTIKATRMHSARFFKCQGNV